MIYLINKIQDTKMKLKVLGSSSAGNCYILDNGVEALVIEAGVPFSEVKKAVDFDIRRIVGCLITHEHKDHSKWFKKFIEARIIVSTSNETRNALIGDNDKDCSPYCFIYRVLHMNEFRLGNFTCMAFDVKHDAARPFGYLIKHPEIGTLLFATDTYYLEYTFNGLNNILIECNYKSEILDDNVRDGLISYTQSNRTLRSHMSYDTCRDTLLANDLSAVNNIVLIHLSDGNSNAEKFRQGIMEATGKTVHIADKGLIININKTPY